MAGSQPGVTQSGEILVITTRGRAGCWHLVGGAKDAAQYSREHRQVPTAENDGAPINKNINSAKVEKSAWFPKDHHRLLLL